MKKLPLPGRTLLIFSGILFGLFFLCACRHSQGKMANELDKEMGNLSRFIDSKFFKEMRGEISELRNKSQETKINLNVFEKKISYLKSQADRLENEYNHLSTSAKEIKIDRKSLDQIKSIKEEILGLEDELKLMKKRKDIKIWRQEKQE